MKKLSILPFLLLTLASINSAATSIEVSGPVSGTWDADTVLVMGDLLVPDGQTLTIAPGSRIICWSHFRINIQGRILAEGNSGDTILFTVRDTANFHNPSTERGGWFGIRFNQTPAQNDTSRFSFCRFEFGKAFGDSVDEYGGAIYARYFGKIGITNCLFYHNNSYFSGGAVYLWNSDACLRNNIFKDNYAGNPGNIYGYGGGVCAMHSSPEITRNVFLRNSSTGVGGGVSFDDADPVFTNNIFENNYSALGGALGVLRCSPASAFSNLLIVNNTSLFFGGGISCIRSFPVFSNLTITNNSSCYGGGIYCNDSAMPSFYNSIIHGNTGLGVSAYIWDIRSAPDFYYCDVEGDTAGFEGSGGHQGYHGEYRYNIDENPGFYGAGLFPYQLTGNSPCIDAGTPDATFLNIPAYDLGFAPRIWNNRIDMGAYEYNGTTGTAGNNASSDEWFSVCPNPFSNSFRIDLKRNLNLKVNFRIKNLQGNVLQDICIPPGTHHYMVDCISSFTGMLPSGAYILEADNGKEKSVKIILKY